MTLRIGIIGAGIMGTDHAQTLHRCVSGASVELIADLDRSRAESAISGIGGARTGDNALAVINDPAVDALIIASHDSTHADLAIASVQAGKPVLCEKPLAPTLDEAVRVLVAQRAAVAASGSDLITVGFMRRFDPGYTEMKAAIRSRQLGAPLIVHSTGRGVSSGPGTTNESSVTNSAIHDLDIVPWLLDSPAVEASWHAPLRSTSADGFQDPQIILLRTADGVLSTIEVFLNARYGYDVRCEVVCEAGTLALTEPTRTIRDRDLNRGTGYARDWRPRFADAYRLELQAWVDAIAGGAPATLATAADGLIASAVADAVLTSMNEGGRTISVAVPRY